MNEPNEIEEGWGLTQFSNKAHYFTYRQSLCGSFGYGAEAKLTKSIGEKRCAECERKYGWELTRLANQALKGESK